jgi:type II secretory pathway pseudopilin PulG
LTGSGWPSQRHVQATLDHAHRRFRRGITLVEVSLSLTILAIVSSMFTTTLISMMRQREVNRQNSLASRAIQSTLERIRNEPVQGVWVLYNPEPLDDPLGPGTAPGHRFDVEGLPRLSTAPGVPVGEILLPGLNVAPPASAPQWELRENLESAELGMPRDLDLDHVIDQQNHGGDCRLLPVQVRLRWQGPLGPREMRMQTVIIDYRMS